MVFYEVSKEQILKLPLLIKPYELIAGQTINLGKILGLENLKLEG